MNELIKHGWGAVQPNYLFQGQLKASWIVSLQEALFSTLVSAVVFPSNIVALFSFNSPASSIKNGNDSGLLMEFRLITLSGSNPSKSFQIGTSSFLPFRVFGMSDTAYIRSVISRKPDSKPAPEPIFSCDSAIRDHLNA